MLLVPRRPSSRPSPGPPWIRILDVDPTSPPAHDLPRGAVDAWVRVAATLVHDGDGCVLGMLRYRPEGVRRWRHAPLHALSGDRFAGSFLPDRPGRWQVQIDAWTNRWASWRADISAKLQGAGQADFSCEIAAGRALLEEYQRLAFVAETLDLVDGVEDQALQLALLLGVEALPDRHELVSLPRPFAIAVEAARSGT